MRCFGRVLALFLLSPLPTATAAQPDADEVSVVRDAERAVLRNGRIAIELALRNGRARTAAIANLRTGDTSILEGEDFVLELEGGRTIAASACAVAGAPDVLKEGDATRLTVSFTHDDLKLRLCTELRPAAWWAERSLEIEGGRGRLARVHLAAWRTDDVRGQPGPGPIVQTLGYPQGCGQAVYAKDLFVAIAHPGADNFAREGSIACSLPDWRELGGVLRTRTLLVGAGAAGDARRAFLGCIHARRATPARMLCLVNDWYWADKSKPLAALEALARLKEATGLPVDTFTLDDGWDLDWDRDSGLWGRLNRTRFPGGWEALQAAGRAAAINVSLWFGPIGGYGGREQRIAFGQAAGYETNGDKLCLAGGCYKQHVIESFSRWASRGMDYIKVDGFWPDCTRTEHGHATGAGGAIAQMDALIDIFAAWRRARPDLAIGYTSGSNPSPFWLEHADWVWRGGADDSHAGAGEPFDRHTTYLDACLQAHRTTDMPISAFVTFDIVQHRIAGNSDAVFERGFWWLAARTSLHHDWYLQASDLTPERWRMLTRAALWARKHERTFRTSRMIGGDPAKGRIYGFAAYDAGAGTLALRNPSAEGGSFQGSLAELLELPNSDLERTFLVTGVFGRSEALAGKRAGRAPLALTLGPFEIAIVELAAAPR